MAHAPRTGAGHEERRCPDGPGSAWTVAGHPPGALGTVWMDQVSRRINGSVAVPACELEALPLPPPEDTEEVAGFRCA